MPDENEKSTDEKNTKRTVPPMTLGADGKATARGIAEHVDALHKAQWDSERKVFRDPITCMLALFTYCRLTAARLADAEDATSRLAERVTALEAWQAEMVSMIEQSQKMALTQFEELEKSAAANGEEVPAEMKALKEQFTLASKPALASVPPSAPTNETKTDSDAPIDETPVIAAPKPKKPVVEVLREDDRVPPQRPERVAKKSEATPPRKDGAA